MNRKTISFTLFAVMLFAIISYSAFGRIDKAVADSTGAEFVIGMNQYFVNDVVPGISMDAAPYIDNGRTMVPVRYLADALGTTTNWDADAKQVIVAEGIYDIVMTIGSTTLTVMNGQTSQMDVAPVINNGRTYLPARWVANALGYQVDWDVATDKIVIIWPKGELLPDFSNVTKVVNLQVSEANGFTIPARTKLGIDTGIGATADVPLSFVIDTKKGDVQSQLADAQNVLSQAKCLDIATVARVMAVINSDMAGVTDESGYINSSNGGGVFLSAYGPTYGNNWWFSVQIHTKPAPSNALILK
jgi:hypothetical protein